jgi:hypothetical protein
LIAINSIENYDGLSSVLKSVKQGEVKDMISIGKPAQKAKIRISTLNNTGNDCTDMVIVGRIPFEGNTTTSQIGGWLLPYGMDKQIFGYSILGVVCVFLHNLSHLDILY